MATKITASQFEFLKSARFWKLFIVAGIIGLKGAGYVPDGLLDTAATIVEFWLGGSVAIRTIDRATEKLGSK